MKKGLVALAVLGAFSGAALAQSSVTLYGILDVNYMWQEVPTTVGTGTSAKVQQESFSSINGGHQSGSRWGMRGSEDLGGGLKAIFDLEGGYDNTTGQLGQGGRLFGRQAYGGIAGNWGAVVAGRLASFSSGTGDFDMFGRVDPFSTGFGLASLGNTFYSANALRVDNAIAYQTPTWAGFKGGIGYSMNISGAETAPSGTNTTAFFSAVNWESGPFFVSVTYDVASAADATPSKPDQKHFQIGGTFDIGAFRLHAGYADQSNIGSVPAVQSGSGAFIALPTGFTNFDATAYMLGATWTMGAFKVFGSYQTFNAKGQTKGTTNFEPDYTIYGIGSTYNLSRRTNLYASYASRDADGTLGGNSFNAKQLALGMRHLF